VTVEMMAEMEIGAGTGSYERAAGAPTTMTATAAMATAIAGNAMTATGGTMTGGIARQLRLESQICSTPTHHQLHQRQPGPRSRPRLVSGLTLPRQHLLNRQRLLQHPATVSSTWISPAVAALEVGALPQLLQVATPSGAATS